MANPFMPSVATSLNQAGGMTLQSILEQRLLQEELAQQQAKLGQSSMMDALSMGLRLRGDQRAAASDAEGTRRFEVTQQRLRERDAATQREKRNQLGVLDMAAQMPEDTPLMTRRRMAIEAGAPMSAFDPEEKEKPFAEKLSETRQLAQASAEGRRAGGGGPKATKVAKDNPKLPTGVKGAIASKKGQPGWENAGAALQSIGKFWDRFLADHPGLDRNTVRTFVNNLYNENITPSGAKKATSVSTPDDWERRKRAAAAAVDGLQSY